MHIRTYPLNSVRKTTLKRAIAVVLLASFLANDVAWAYPDLLNPGQNNNSNLQIPSVIKHTSDETLIETVVMKLCLSFGPQLPNVRLRLTPTEKGKRFTVVFDPENIKGDRYVIPCRVGDRRYVAVRDMKSGAVSVEKVAGGGTPVGQMKLPEAPGAFDSPPVPTDIAKTSDEISDIIAEDFKRNPTPENLGKIIVAIKETTDANARWRLEEALGQGLANNPALLNDIIIAIKETTDANARKSLAYALGQGLIKKREIKLSSNQTDVLITAIKEKETTDANARGRLATALGWGLANNPALLPAFFREARRLELSLSEEGSIVDPSIESRVLFHTNEISEGWAIVLSQVDEDGEGALKARIKSN